MIAFAVSVILAVGMVIALIVLRDVMRDANKRESDLLDRLTYALERPRPALSSDHIEKEAEQPDEPAYMAHIGGQIETIPEEWE